MAGGVRGVEPGAQVAHVAAVAQRRLSHQAGQLVQRLGVPLYRVAQLARRK